MKLPRELLNRIDELNSSSPNPAIRINFTSQRFAKIGYVLLVIILFSTGGAWVQARIDALKIGKIYQEMRQIPIAKKLNLERFDIEMSKTNLSLNPWNDIKVLEGKIRQLGALAITNSKSSGDY